MRNTLLIAFIFIFHLSYSQTFTGKISDPLGKPIPLANVLIKDTSDLISEFILARNGQYKLTLQKNYTRLIIEINSQGYFPEVKLLENLKRDSTYLVNFILESDTATELKTIVIEAPKKPITIQGDTVSYDVNSFRDGSERKIEDIIKKLPGIEVNETSGEIKYKGKSIETVTLDGDNLFDYNYTLGTRNINVDMVEQVQAIENYSENSLLKGIEQGGKVALNLKLKKGKYDFSGSLGAGVGINAQPNAVYGISTDLLGVNQQHKSFGNFSVNNFGMNNSPFDYIGFSLNPEQVKEQNYYTQRIVPETNLTTALDQARTNINRQLFGNYNSIFKLHKKVSLKTNLYYLTDKLTSQQFFKNEVNINENEQFVTSDRIFITKAPLYYRGDLEIKFNSSKKSLLEYDLKIRQEEINTSSEVISNGQNRILTSLRSEDFFLKQGLLFTYRFNNQKALQTFISYSDNQLPQALSVSPDVNENIFLLRGNQATSPQKNYLEGKLTLLGASNKAKYSFTLGGFSNNYSLKTLLSSDSLGNVTITSQNNLRYTQQSVYGIATFNKSLGRFLFSPAFTTSFLSQNLQDRSENITTNRPDIILEPALTLAYWLNNYSKLVASTAYNQAPLVEKYVFRNDVLINNRSVIFNRPSLDLQNTISYSFNYLYNDLINRQLSIFSGINYRENQGAFFNDLDIQPLVTRLGSFFLPESNSSLSFNLSSEKFIPLISSNIELTSAYSINFYKNVVNNSELRDNQSDIFNLSFKINTGFDFFLNFENQFSFARLFSQTNENNISFINTSLNNNLKILVKPTKQWFSSISFDYFLPATVNFTQNYLFIDLSIRFTPKNKKFEFELVANNLLNESTFRQVNTSDFSINTFESNLIPRYILLAIGYNF